MEAAGYRELLLNSQALHSDLQKTLADKQHTLVRGAQTDRAYCLFPCRQPALDPEVRCCSVVKFS